ncbi:PiggyBac transposable element-derived protein 4 [Eumeta japonica]|uniref:PiggyBac transposable element-derived protein 4 n=1 Tax=Eumeta variegata TaxID=151549 RepID=A0A4C1YNI2_EUMVA|nr:PiggyBac transposable element-derived protein 4 [Eumeta japonica]
MPTLSDNDKQPLPNAKSKQPLAASNQQLLTKVLNIKDIVSRWNFYNSPALARYLKCRGFDCLGTVRLTRKNIPEDVKEMKKTVKRARSLLATRRCNGVGMEGCKIVSMISTFHDNSTYTGTRAGEECEKPICVKDYNTTMGALI